MRTLAPLLLTSLVLTAACATQLESTPLDSSAAPLMVDHAGTPIALTIDAPTSGAFSKSKRVYGYTFEVKAGATVQVTLDTRAGAGASVAAGSKLDTLIEVYGPMRDGVALGAADKLAGVDDDGTGRSAALPALSIRHDGKYLVVFSSWDDAGDASTFTVKAACSGTEFQCKKPLPVGACEPGTKFVRASDVVATETWRACEVVLLETITVPATAMLTIAPGVTVKGNYLGTTRFGNVNLIVNGQLQAVGTADRPVTFTSYAADKGWKGIVLNSPSNTIENAYIENAEVGLTFAAGNNTVRSTSINSGGAGIVIQAGSVDNTLSRVRVTKNDNGISLGTGASAIIEDAVVSGNGTDRGVGIRSESQVASFVRRSFVGSFQNGMLLSASALEVNESIIAGNRTGVYMTAPGAARYQPECPEVRQPPPPPPPPPATWPSRDPIFRDTDIVKNSAEGIHVDARELLVVERCNLTQNGVALLNEAAILHPDSRIVNSNVFGNGSAGLQVDTLHVTGQLNISDNYWAQLSDPALSASWRTAHAYSRGCSRTAFFCTGGENTLSDSIYSCSRGALGAWTGSCYNSTTYSCSGTYSTSQSGNVTFTGFSPIALSAGPHATALTDDVKNARAALP